MNDVLRQTDLEIIRRYTGQPGRLPRDLRARIEDQWGGDPVQLYALVDLDASMRLTRAWLCLGPEQLAIARPGADPQSYEIATIDRRRIRAVRERPGLSCSVLSLLGEPDEAALAVLRYTHRQRLSVENIRFVLEEALRGRAVPTGEADVAYVDGLARPIREAQALVARREIAVLWRLLSYLRPYRGRVVSGMTAAAFITVFSLAPPTSRAA